MSSVGKIRLQLTNGYVVNFDQLARLLNFVHQDGRAVIPLAEIATAVGVSDIHAEFLARIANVMGLVALKTRQPTPLASQAVVHDAFFDDVGTLWMLHYIAASNPQNLVWNRFANVIVPEAGCFTISQFRNQFEDVKAQFTKNSFSAYINKETRSLLDAYTVQNFSRLEYLQREGEDGFRLSYRESMPPLVLAACIARYRDQHRSEDNAFSISDLLTAPNSPGVVCQITEDRLRAGLEALKSEAGFSLESRADLDQVRLTDATPDYGWSGIIGEEVREEQRSGEYPVECQFVLAVRLSPPYPPNSGGNVLPVVRLYIAKPSNFSTSLPESGVGGRESVPGTKVWVMLSFYKPGLQEILMVEKERRTYTLPARTLRRFEERIASGKRSAKMAEIMEDWIREQEREALRQDIIEGCREMGEIYLEIAKEWEASDNEVWSEFEPYSPAG